MKVILEGFWGLGKSTVAELMCLNGYTYIHEPDHTAQLKVQLGVDALDKWYVTEHAEKLGELVASPSNRDIVMERSVLSSYAYSYAQGNEPEVNAEFIKKIAGADIKIYFLNANNEFLKFLYGKRVFSDTRTSLLLKDEHFINKYREYFLKIVGDRYGLRVKPIECAQKLDRLPKEIVQHVILNEISK